MTYTFKNTLANSEVLILEDTAIWMVQQAFRPHSAKKKLKALDAGEIEYIAVQNGRITKGANGND